MFPISIEGEGKAKKNKGLPPLSDLASSSSRAPVMEMEEEVKASLDLGVPLKLVRGRLQRIKRRGRRLSQRLE